MSANCEERPSPIEKFLDRMAAAFSWIWLALILVIATAVVLRFVFGIGLIQLEELQWHLYAAGFLVGIVACAGRDRHVRVDVLRESMSARTRDWIDLYGTLLLQIPFLILVLASSLPFVADSFVVSERSASAGGLPYRWLLKSMLPISFALLLITACAKLIATWRRLFADRSEGPGR